MKCWKCDSEATTEVKSTPFQGLEYGYCDEHKPSPKDFRYSDKVLQSAPQSPGRWSSDLALSPLVVEYPNWHFEDMIYPRSTAVVMAPDGKPFLSWMKKVAETHAFTVCEFSFSDDGWNRDPVLRTMQGPSLFNAPPQDANPFPNKNLKHGSQQMSSGWLSNPRTRGPRLSDQGFGQHDIPVAGGNIITARDKEGKVKFIVGELGLYAIWKSETFGGTLDITHSHEIFRGKGGDLHHRALKAGYDPEQYLMWKNAKARVRKVLLGSASVTGEEWIEAKRRVLFVPQWAYHIDLQMLYVGQGVIALHSFTEQWRLLDEVYPGSPQLKDIEGLQEQYGVANEWARKLLTKHGFEVIEVAGCFPLQTKNGAVASDRRMIARYFNFMNGIALHEGKLLVCHEAKTKEKLIERAYDRFTHQLQEKGIEVVPVGSHLGSGSNVNAFMLNQQGGLRCKTTLLPMSYAAPLSALTNSEKEKKNNKYRPKS